MGLNKSDVYLPLGKLNPLELKKALDIFSSVSSHTKNIKKLGDINKSYIIYDTSVRDLTVTNRAGVRVNRMTEIGYSEFLSLFGSGYEAQVKIRAKMKKADFLNRSLILEDFDFKEYKMLPNSYYNIVVGKVATVVNFYGNDFYEVKPEGFSTVFKIPGDLTRAWISKFDNNKNNNKNNIMTETTNPSEINLSVLVDFVESQDGKHKLRPSELFGSKFIVNGVVREVLKYDAKRNKYGTYQHKDGPGAYLALEEILSALTIESGERLQTIINPTPLIGRYVNTPKMTFGDGGKQAYEKYYGLIGRIDEVKFDEKREQMLVGITFSDENVLYYSVYRIFDELIDVPTDGSEIVLSPVPKVFVPKQPSATTSSENTKLSQSAFQVKFRANTAVVWRGIECTVKALNEGMLILRVNDSKETISASPTSVVRLLGVGELVYKKQGDEVVFKYLTEEDDATEFSGVYDDSTRKLVSSIL